MTPQSAVDKVKKKANGGGGLLSIQDMIEKSTLELGRALPSHMRPERIVRIALTTLRMNPTLYQCDKNSFLAALFQSAQLGLEPNIEGEAYIIPYRVKGVQQAQFQIGYQGFIKLFWNHQSSVSIQAEAVHENDVFEYDLGKSLVTHIPPGFGTDRGKVIGYYATAELANKGHALKVLSRSEAEEFGKRFSKCYDKQAGKFKANTPWASHFDAMAKKTVLKQLMKLLPKSVEIQRALKMDETVKSSVGKDMYEVPAEEIYADAETDKAPAQIESEKHENGTQSREPGEEG